MSILDQLASVQGRRDEEPNIAVAEQIAASGDAAAVAALVGQLQGKDKAIAHDCIKALYELGARRPEMIVPYVDAFVVLIKGRDNRMIWGGMTALGAIASIDAAAAAPHTKAIRYATEHGCRR